MRAPCTSVNDASGPTIQRSKRNGPVVIGALIPESGKALPPARIQNTCEAQRYLLPGVRGRLRLVGGTRQPAAAAVNRLLLDAPWRVRHCGVRPHQQRHLGVTLCVGPLRNAVFTLLSVRAPVRLPRQLDAWAWQGNTGRLIGPDMRMRSRPAVGQADGEAQGAGSHPGARSRRLPS